MLLSSIWSLSLCLFSAAGALAAKNDQVHHPTVYLIRHGEKPADPGNHELTLEGLKRAQCLRQVFGAKSEYNIGYIMAPKMKSSNGGHGRAFKTVQPLAADLGLDVDMHCGRKNTDCVADAIRSYDGAGDILVSWRHTNMGQIQAALGSDEPVEYPDDRGINESCRYDLVWTIPYPYHRITVTQSEKCPGLDARDHPDLVVQY
ncbi:uncharacterized protein N7483_001962 [Penicillium malachiteum]|uniref:uncharacterized protein n=1 Tax=Penicillium malachiteum TaxID=1324776 RepID=UPI002548E117|nr:uncharacterized protein N7483_001962 [Penicillium malachiteum]KAJ5736837.1 hypothetical protein N7483_001962 [Penicillium malachiteum]